MSDQLDPRDAARIASNTVRVHYLMTHPLGQWWTLSDLHESVGGSESAPSARVRDLRKVKFGGFIVERRRLESGVSEYRAIRPGGAHQLGLL